MRQPLLYKLSSGRTHLTTPDPELSEAWNCQDAGALPAGRHRARTFHRADPAFDRLERTVQSGTENPRSLIDSALTGSKAIRLTLERHWLPLLSIIYAIMYLRLRSPLLLCFPKTLLRSHRQQIHHARSTRRRFASHAQCIIHGALVLAALVRLVKTRPRTQDSFQVKDLRKTGRCRFAITNPKTILSRNAPQKRHLQKTLPRLEIRYCRVFRRTN